jgi:splicing factor 3B subunit 1
VINNVVEAIEALRVALGPATIMQYLLQGLYHPARKVRESYWRVYNSTYIGAQDAIVAYYPRLENDGVNVYQRYDLDYFL